MDNEVTYAHNYFGLDQNAIGGVVMPRQPKYPSKPHSSGQARICVAGKRIYLGKFGSPESYVKFHRVMKEYMATGSPPGQTVEPVLNVSRSGSRSMIAAPMVEHYVGVFVIIYQPDKRESTQRLRLALG